RRKGPVREEVQGHHPLHLRDRRRGCGAQGVSQGPGRRPRGSSPRDLEAAGLTAAAMAPEPAAPAFAALEAHLEAKRKLVQAALRRLHDPGRAPQGAAAVEDSLFAPAKRLRPILSLMVAEVLRAQPEPVLPAACAIEMVHTASLILDDLPAMDDAAVRRGRPACHVRHGQANAILAAFALQNRAFEILAGAWPGAREPAPRAPTARQLAGAGGTDGMIAGQAADLAMTEAAMDFATLEFIHSRKTGALFIASAELGALAAGAAERERAAVVT